MISASFLVPFVLLLAPTWHLPTTLSDANTAVHFAVDSTWHLVEGTTRNITGKAWLENPKDFHSVRAELDIPVSLFDTDNSRRDTRLREVMAEPRFPTVHVTIQGQETLCAPDAITETKPCSTELLSTVTIRGVTKSFSLPTTVSRVDAGYLVKGELPLRWADFGVEDPSIFIAKLKPVVTVSFEVHLRPQEGDA